MERADYITSALPLARSDANPPLNPPPQGSRVIFKLGTHLASIWLHSLLAARLKMRPGWSRLALRSLVRAVPAWPRCGLGWPWLRIRGRGWEWPGAAKLLIRFHLLPFRPIPYRLRGARGARFPPSRERRSAFVVATHDQCKGWRGVAARGICRRAAGGSRSRWLSRQQ